MPTTLDDRLEALSHVDYAAPLDGLEGAVFSRMKREKMRTSVAAAGVQCCLVAAALALGLVVGLGSGAKPSVYGSEMRVLSDASMLTPSMRLGGV
jgi:hypothetical protein